MASEAVAYLNSVAGVLGKMEGHAALPDGDGLTDLLAQVDELSESIRASADLDDDLSSVLLRRITQMRFAIENARVGGVEGVAGAVEQLLGAMIVRHAAVPSWTARKVVAVAAASFAVFSAGPTIQDSLDAWPAVIERLTPGPDHDTPANETTAEQPNDSETFDDGTAP